MKRFGARIPLSVILFLSICWIRSAAQTPAIAIEGSVVQAGTDEPLPGASVQLLSPGGAKAYVMVTQNEGRFQFRNVPPGDYTLSAVRNGYIRSEYGKRSASDRPLTLTVTPSRSVSNLRIRMVPAGAIYGRVTDGKGDPLALAVVSALQTTYINGQRALRLVATVSTDDLGNYRLFALPPGKYFVSALLGLGTDIPRYSPGTLDVREARVIDLKAGESGGGVDITYRRESGPPVRGTVNSGGSAAKVVLMPLFPIVNEAPRSVTVQGGSAGFSIPQIAPGDYVLTVVSDGLSAQTRLDVRGTAPVDIRVALSSPVEIPARISSSKDFDPENVRLGIRSEYRVTGVPDLDLVPSKEHDLMIRVGDGNYHVEAKTLPPHAYIESIRWGIIDVLKNGFDARAGITARMEIVLGNNPGSIDGVVTTPTRRSEPNVVVVLAPPANPQRLDLFRSVRTNSDGRFTLPDVPPGDYILYAWESVEPTAWLNREFMQDYENLGQVVHVAAGSHQSVQIEAIPEF